MHNQIAILEPKYGLKKIALGEQVFTTVLVPLDLENKDSHFEDITANIVKLNSKYYDLEAELETNHKRIVSIKHDDPSFSASYASPADSAIGYVHIIQGTVTNVIMSFHL